MSFPSHSLFLLTSQRNSGILCMSVCSHLKVENATWIYGVKSTQTFWGRNNGYVTWASAKNPSFDARVSNTWRCEFFFLSLKFTSRSKFKLIPDFSLGHSAECLLPWCQSGWRRHICYPQSAWRMEIPHLQAKKLWIQTKKCDCCWERVILAVSASKDG